MSIDCTCGVNAGNLGTVNCPPQIGKILRTNFVNRYKDDGTENYIDTTVTLNKAFFDALQYHTDTSERVYPLPEDLEEVETPKGETVYKSYASGRKVKIRQGQRDFTAQLPLAAAAMIGKINARGCTKQSVYLFTTIGVLGVRKEAGKLHPIAIAPETIDAMLALQTDADAQHAVLMMQWAQDVEDKELSIIPYSKITGIDLFTQFKGKLDANIEQVGSKSTTTFSVKITNDYGDAVDLFPVKNLIAADFVLYNVTDSAAVTISTCTESPDGTYVFTFTAQTNTDKLRLSLGTTAAAKPYDDATWADVEIVLQ